MRRGAPARCSIPSRAAARGIAVTGRKGGVFMRFEITGKAAHSGANFEAGISAINELAHKTLALHALTDPGKGVTLNVGVVVGRADRQHRGAVGEGRGRPALHHAATSAGRPWRRSRRSWPRASCPAPRAKLEITGEFLPLVETADGKSLFQHYAAGVARARQRVRARFHRRLCRLRVRRGDRRADHLRRRSGRRQRRTRRRNLWRSNTLVPRAQALALAILRLPT